MNLIALTSGAVNSGGASGMSQSGRICHARRRIQETTTTMIGTAQNTSSRKASTGASISHQASRAAATGIAVPTSQSASSASCRDLRWRSRAASRRRSVNTSMIMVPTSHRSRPRRRIRRDGQVDSGPADGDAGGPPGTVAASVSST